jgi:hypothetical protein
MGEVETLGSNLKIEITEGPNPAFLLHPLQPRRLRHPFLKVADLERWPWDPIAGQIETGVLGLDLEGQLEEADRVEAGWKVRILYRVLVQVPLGRLEEAVDRAEGEWVLPTHVGWSRLACLNKEPCWIGLIIHWSLKEDSWNRTQYPFHLRFRRRPSRPVPEIP